MPHVALSALALETDRLASVAARATRAALEGDADARAAADRTYGHLLQAIIDAVDRLGAQPLPADIATGTRRIMRVCRHLTVSTEQAAIVVAGLPLGEVRDAARSSTSSARTVSSRRCGPRRPTQREHQTRPA